MSSDAVEAHIHKALLILADLAANAGLQVEHDLRALAERLAPGPVGRA